MLADLATLFPLIVEVRRATARTGYGKATEIAAVEHRARITMKRRAFPAPSKAGAIEFAEGVAWLASTTVAGTGDKLAVLPSGPEFNIVAVETTADENGPLFSKVFFR